MERPYNEVSTNNTTNKQRIEKNQDYYRRRQAIVEHPYGTIQWGFSYILTRKGIDRAGSDVGFMFTAYNLRRLINVIGLRRLTEYLQVFLSTFSSHSCHFKALGGFIFHSSSNRLQKISIAISHIFPKFKPELSPNRNLVWGFYTDCLRHNNKE